MIGPVVDGALVVRGWTNNIRGLGVVVETVGRYPGDVSEAIPLGAALCIELVCIIVGNVLCESLDLVLESFSGESRDFRVIQRKTRPEGLVNERTNEMVILLLQRDHLPTLYLAGRRSLDSGWCQEVQSANLSK